MDFSEVLLYLELKKKEKSTLVITELKMMLLSLDNYEQVKLFTSILLKEPNISRRFLTGSLIKFIEEYHDFIKVRNYVLHNSRLRNYKMLFKHQIRLSKTKEDAIRIVKEATDFGQEIPGEWVNEYDAIWSIKNEQNVWRKNINKMEYKRFYELYEKFSRMKSRYFDTLAIEDFKKIIEKKPIEEEREIVQKSIFIRKVYIKEFARKVAKGICQLCDKKAPFIDKQGKPFLEVHHIFYLSKGGSDTIDNVVALCPNCHRKMHLLELEEDIIKIKGKALTNMIV
jgi:hypothetical protein